MWLTRWRNHCYSCYGDVNNGYGCYGDVNNVYGCYGDVNNVYGRYDNIDNSHWCGDNAGDRKGRYRSESYPTCIRCYGKTNTNYITHRNNGGFQNLNNSCGTYEDENSGYYHICYHYGSRNNTYGCSVSIIDGHYCQDRINYTKMTKFCNHFEKFIDSIYCFDHHPNGNCYNIMDDNHEDTNQDCDKHLKEIDNLGCLDLDASTKDNKDPTTCKVLSFIKKHPKSDLSITSVLQVQIHNSNWFTKIQSSNEDCNVKVHRRENGIA